MQQQAQVSTEDGNTDTYTDTQERENAFYENNRLRTRRQVLVGEPQQPSLCGVMETAVGAGWGGPGEGHQNLSEGSAATEGH